jgi:hypothetical protein
MNRKPRLIAIPPQHLGHEVHVARSVVVDMLAKGFLLPDCGDSVLTGLADRKFFYDALFGHQQVFDFSIIPGLTTPISAPKTPSEYLNVSSNQIQTVPEFADFDIVNLAPYALPPTYCTFTATSEMLALGYDIPSRFFNAEFARLVKTFALCDPSELCVAIPADTHAFVVVHHRYKDDFDQLFRVLAALPFNLVKIVFTSNSEEAAATFRGLPNTFFTRDLRLYSSALQDPRCKLLISEWSGAGQLAQYLLGDQGVIWYYYGAYSDIYNFVATHKIWESNALLGTYFNCWDFKNISGCDIRHFADFRALLGAVKTIQSN